MSTSAGEVAGADIADLVRSHIRDVPDYPTPGVMFRDITPLLADHDAFEATVSALSAAVPDGVDVVAGVEARGFILAAPVALRVGAGFVPVRKIGKLPARTVSASYDLEYGSAQIEVHADAFTPGQRVVVLDDVLATGGTAAATCELIERVGAKVVGVLFLLELGFLDGRARLPGRPVHSLVTY